MGNEAELSDNGRVADVVSHEVGPDQIFFSTTDAKGIIKDVNSVFIDLARFPREEMIGAPHNLIRNDIMPGGAFKLCWDDLAAGEPWVGYVANRAKDGSRYDVLATITPLENGDYLSVRIRPGDRELSQTLWDVYRDIRTQELEQRETGGMSRIAAAEWSEGILLEKVKELGFPTYRDFMMWLLPHEVDLWEEQNPRPFAAPTQGEYVKLGGLVAQLLDEEEVWMDRQTQLTSLGVQLVKGVDALEETLTISQRVNDEMDKVEDSGQLAEDEMIPLEVGLRLSDIVGDYANDLRSLLAELNNSTQMTRFAVALARLQTQTVGRFVEEMAAGTDEADPILTLCQALTIETMDLSGEIRQHQTLVQRAKRRITTVLSLVSLPQMAVTKWRSDILNSGLAGKVSDLLKTVADSIDAMTVMVREMENLIIKCEEVEPDHGPEALVDTVQQVDMEARVLAGEPLDLDF
ncbi:MAG: PAS domain-containing protein [Corynebacterium sp.]|nr:PAS domain-containing protein [Corynebacterium sp.]